MDSSGANATLLELIRQAAAASVTSPPEPARGSSGASSHNSSVCSETDESRHSQPDVSALLQAILAAVNRPASESDRRPTGTVYSSVPEWDDPIPSPEESDFHRYRAHLERHLPGFVYFEREELKRTLGKGRSGRSYFCRQIRKTVSDHGITGERHINIDRAVDQVLLYCPALERTTAERERDQAQNRE
ncbi:Hypp9640, partial [Branchiostoma lanceolatum]